MQQQVQQEAVRLSLEHELGPLKSEYGMWGTGHPLLAAAIQFLSMCFFCFLTYFLYSEFLQSVQAGPASGNGYCCLTRLSSPGDADPHDSPVGWLIFLSFGSLVFSIFFCWDYWRRYPFRYSRQFLYEHGFLLIACRSKHIIGSEAIRWRDIGTIWHTFFYDSDADSRSESYIILDRSGTVFGSRIRERLKERFWLYQLIQRHSLRRVKHSDPLRSLGHRFDVTLGKQIEQLTLPSLLPQALATFEQGIPIRFGPLTLHTRGIEYQGKLLPWHEFDCSRLVYQPSTDKEPETLYFLKQVDHPSWRRPYWAAVSCSQVPHFALLHHLILSIAASPPPISCIPLVAGKPATITYHGRLSVTASSLTMHWGYNTWKSITDTAMTNLHDGIWQANITIPLSATVLNMAFYDQSDTWDNHQHMDYHLPVSPHNSLQERTSPDIERSIEE